MAGKGKKTAAAKTAAKIAAKEAAKKAVAKAGAAIAANPAVITVLAVVAVVMVLAFATILIINSSAWSAAADCGSNQPDSGLLAPGGGKYVGYSVFGGPNDPSTGHTGYRGDNLEDHPLSYAELSNNPTAGLANLDYAALGKLPYKAALRVTGPKGSLILRKRDVGAGGGKVGSPPTKRALDIWYPAAERLGLSFGTGRVKVERIDRVPSGGFDSDDSSSSTSGGKVQMKFPLPLAATERPEGGYGRKSAVKGVDFLEGVELRADAGVSVAAPVGGKVRRAGWLDEYGYYVAIERTSVTYVLARLKKRPSVKRGARVEAGEVVGEVGRTGGSHTGALLKMEPHLEVRMYDLDHTLGVEVRKSGAIDPTKYLQGAYDGSGATTEELDAAGNCTGNDVPDGMAGSWSKADTPKQIIDREVLPVARANGIQVTAKSVTEANHRHGPTISGGTSDHQGPPEVAWAADLSNGTSPTKQMDALAKALAEKFGGLWPGSGAVSWTKKGFRFQLIYRSMVGGNHFNHVHIGIRKG